MSQFKISSVDENDSGWTFTVELESRKHTVTLSEDYWRQLTDGKMEPQQLIEASFDFLLEREPASSIMSEFDLTVIKRYFPEYEDEIASRL